MNKNMLAIAITPDEAAEIETWLGFAMESDCIKADKKTKNRIGALRKRLCWALSSIDYKEYRNKNGCRDAQP